MFYNIDYWNEYYHYDKLVRKRLALYREFKLREFAKDMLMDWDNTFRLDFIQEHWGDCDDEGTLFEDYEGIDLKWYCNDIIMDMDSKEIIEFLVEQGYAGESIDEYKTFLRETAEEFNILPEDAAPEPIYRDPNQLSLLVKEING